MKVLLDIPDSKAASLMDVLKSISYVKTKPLTDAKALLLEELREAVEEMKSGRADAVVTGPVSKEGLQAVGFPFPGQTEFVAAACSYAPGDAVMMLADRASWPRI